MTVDTSLLQDSPQPVGSVPAPDSGFVSKLRTLSIEALHLMYVPSERLFVFRLQREGDWVVSQGLSPRYTAITLLGLVNETPEAIQIALHGDNLLSVCDRLAQTAISRDNIGDVALALWAANMLGYASPDLLRERMLALGPLDGPCPTVELSWVLMASCVDRELVRNGFVYRAARRLLAAFNPDSGVFPHVVGTASTGPRGHVSCFADFVYPIQSLSEYHKVAGDAASLAAAVRCAEQACRNQGPEGQWWWHYDRRTGDVVERYPVYTVHQHGMGPMALFALQEAGGPGHDDAVSKGLGWLACSPEINGSTIDENLNLIWRKVARREPRKLARKLQAAASYVHPSMRVAGVDWALPARAVDFECRPYELGWLLYAWPKERAAKWSTHCQLLV